MVQVGIKSTNGRWEHEVLSVITNFLNGSNIGKVYVVDPKGDTARLWKENNDTATYEIKRFTKESYKEMKNIDSSVVFVKEAQPSGISGIGIARVITSFGDKDDSYILFEEER